MLTWDLHGLQQLPVDAGVALHGVDEAEREELVVVVVSVVQCSKQGTQKRSANQKKR